MKKIEIFEVALCCSTGVCGPAVNEDLLRITAAVNKINASGGNAIRYNLNSNPEMYVKNQLVNEILMKDGESVFIRLMLTANAPRSRRKLSLSKDTMYSMNKLNLLPKNG